MNSRFPPMTKVVGIIVGLFGGILAISSLLISIDVFLTIGYTDYGLLLGGIFVLFFGSLTGFNFLLIGQDIEEGKVKLRWKIKQ